MTQEGKKLTELDYDLAMETFIKRNRKLIEKMEDVKERKRETNEALDAVIKKADPDGNLSWETSFQASSLINDLRHYDTFDYHLHQRKLNLLQEYVWCLNQERIKRRDHFKVWRLEHDADDVSTKYIDYVNRLHLVQQQQLRVNKLSALIRIKQINWPGKVKLHDATYERIGEMGKKLESKRVEIGNKFLDYILYYDIKAKW